jgi:hypothetical protein
MGRRHTINIGIWRRGVQFCWDGAAAATDETGKQFKFVPGAPMMGIAMDRPAQRDPQELDSRCPPGADETFCVYGLRRGSGQTEECACRLQGPDVRTRLCEAAQAARMPEAPLPFD